MPFVTVLAGACFLISSFYLIRDRKAVKAIVNGQTDENRTLLDHGDGDSDGGASNDIPNGDVRNNDVTNYAVTSNDVRPDDVTYGDLKPNNASINDNTSRNEEEQSFGEGRQSPRDSISDDEVTQHLINV